ncbi:membrane protein insertion efficiency factor YidD [soil metagenome]
MSESHASAARALAAAVRAYQRVTAGRPSPCRFEPSCSSYALDALATFGAGRGGRLALGRILRCHPWGGHGWDPVPAPDPAHRSHPAPKAV